MTLVFVYGTLMQGECRHKALARQKFLGPATTAPKYLMLDCGNYPALVEPVGLKAPGKSDSARTAGDAIVGELYEVDSETLSRLDDIEEVATGLYRRSPIELAAPHQNLDAEAWFYAQPTTDFPPCGPSWRNRPRHKQSLDEDEHRSTRIPNQH